jgi:hypothetical protein
MAVVPLTLAIGLCLVFTFVAFFLRQHARGRLSSVERDSLLPFADEAPRFALPQGDQPVPVTVSDDLRDASPPPSAVSSKMS